MAEKAAGTLAAIKRWLSKSSVVHLRQEAVSTPSDLVDLIDRFVGDGLMRYPLEWDDFISWEQNNPHVEAARQAICVHETWLFSKDKRQRLAYANLAIDERNRLAAIIGRPARTHLDQM